MISCHIYIYIYIYRVTAYDIQHDAITPRQHPAEADRAGPRGRRLRMIIIVIITSISLSLSLSIYIYIYIRRYLKNDWIIDILYLIVSTYWISCSVMKIDLNDCFLKIL